MAASDALVVVDDWISEYYFTSDDTSRTYLARTLARVGEWKTATEETPGCESPLSAFTSSRVELLSALLNLQEEVARLDEETVEDAARRRAVLAAGSTEVADRLLRILGYTDGEGRGRRWSIDRTGPLRRIGLSSVPARPLAVLDALAADTAADVLAKDSGLLTSRVVLAEGTPEEQAFETVARALSALAVEEDGPSYMLVTAGRHVIVTSADMWPQGRYLAIDLQTVAERGDLRRGGETQRAVTALAADSLAPDESGAIWWDAVREESVANAVGVSADLREGVRDSIEIIANEVIDRRRRRSLPDLPDDSAQDLALQSLRYLYRILFLLHAEASPELAVLPSGAPEYQNGYSVDRLREMTLREVPTGSVDGTYLYESLQRLMTLVNVGHRAEDEPAPSGDRAGERAGSLTFENLEADLFTRERTRLIDEVGLGNAALQKVLGNLLLSKERRGKDRGFISYVALGINQLGAVYESLMSYTGAFAHEELVEVARNGDPEQGSWVVPADAMEPSLEKHLVMVHDETGQAVPRRYRHGQFVFRLSGRARQQSASYYSPEVITRFTVSQGLEELLDPVIGPDEELPAGSRTREDVDFDGAPVRRRITTAQEVLELTVCEPALGSGAFAIETVRRLAEEYLRRRQEELDERIPPEEYATELQRAKAYIALHNVHGVDLNPTAVELAEISLWLDSMTAGLKAPWFGLRLRAGNSLIGARHALYDTTTVRTNRLAVTSAEAPRPVPVATVEETPAADGGRAGVSRRVFHFLLPGQGWGCAGDDKEIKTLAPEAAKEVREWARALRGKPTKKQVEELESLTRRIEDLWSLALRRLREARIQSRRAIPVWGAETPSGGGVTRAEIERSLADENSAYQRLRLVMDAWCALWFWPVIEEDEVSPPDLDEWLTVVRAIVGKTFTGVTRSRRGRTEHVTPLGGAGYLGASTDEWNALDEVEGMFGAEGASRIDDLVVRHPWLARAREIAREQRFFHWELDFAPVFAERGGFDLQVGNPPWVRPALDVGALFSEFDPWWALTDKPAEQVKKSRRERNLDAAGARTAVLAGTRDVASLAEFAGAASMYPELAGTQPDLYRNFMARTWANSSGRGVVALVHPPTHLTDARGYALRKETYRRLRRHWRFINELHLFHEIDNHVEYSINIYGTARTVDFLSAVGVYHPKVVEDSLRHDGSGPEPGFKDAEGRWDLTAHRGRILRVGEEQLTLWHRLMEGASADVAPAASRMLAVVNRASGEVLAKLANSAQIGESSPAFSAGWHESGARRDGYFESRWGEPDSWRDVILQGPYFHVGNPFNAARNEAMGSNRDYTSIDLDRLPADAKPITEYKPIHEEGADGRPDTHRYDGAYGRWTLSVDEDGKPLKTTPVRDHYRVMWRTMAATTGVRTLVPAIYPPGAASVDAVCGFGFPGDKEREFKRVAIAGASMGSILADYLARTTVNKHIRRPEAERLPLIPEDHRLCGAAMHRSLRLNCLTRSYSDLWRVGHEAQFQEDSWAGGVDRPDRPALGDVGPEWTPTTPLRRAEDRRQALLEIDAIMAIVTGVTIDELVTIYRTQFGVLNSYDRGDGRNAYIFDAHGRQLPSDVRTKWNKAGRPEKGMSAVDRTSVIPNPYGDPTTITFEEPFRILDREADLRQAYAEFTRRMEA